MKRRKECACVAALFCLLFLGGCATHKDVMGLEDRLAVAEEREKELQVKVEVLDSLLAEQNDLIYSMRAELKTGLESVTRGVEAVSEAVKYREPEGYTDILSPSQIPAPTRERLGPILEEPPREESPRVMEGALSQGAFPDRGTETSPPVAAAPGRELYDTAYLDMTRGNFELAMQGFEEYIASGQRAELKDNAQYWIGECFYAMGRFHEAIDAFQKVVDEYPRENKVPSALFKIGKCYFELGDKEEAQRYFQSVIGGYPQSEEANLAREYLADLR